MLPSLRAHKTNISIMNHNTTLGVRRLFFNTFWLGACLGWDHSSFASQAFIAITGGNHNDVNMISAIDYNDFLLLLNVALCV